MELHAPHLLSRFGGGLDSFDGRIIAIDEEWLPSSREWVLQLQGVLVILAETIE
jgi:hypothetical protein